jgi:hypothetical protein
MPVSEQQDKDITDRLFAALGPVNDVLNEAGKAGLKVEIVVLSPPGGGQMVSASVQRVIKYAP